MLMDELLEAAGRPRAEVEAAIAWGIEQAWLRHDTAYVALRAAGIHVAKECSIWRDSLLAGSTGSPRSF
jgi:hypothetical protein